MDLSVTGVEVRRDLLSTEDRVDLQQWPTSCSAKSIAGRYVGRR